jgi:hypothetical protein
MDVIHFTRGAADPLNAFDAKRVSCVPLAEGRGASHVSCAHLGAGRKDRSTLAYPRRDTAGRARPDHRRDQVTAQPNSNSLTATASSAQHHSNRGTLQWCAVTGHPAKTRCSKVPC